jgi:hypothetical protein
MLSRRKGSHLTQMTSPFELVEQPLSTIDRVLECETIANESPTTMLDSQTPFRRQNA